jgi:hypothetical protein
MIFEYYRHLSMSSLKIALADARVVVIDARNPRAIGTFLVPDQLPGDSFAKHCYILSRKVIGNTGIKQYTAIGSDLLITSPQYKCDRHIWESVNDYRFIAVVCLAPS